MTNQKKILVVDDMPINRLTTCLTVRNYGFTAEEADSAEAAIIKIKSNRYSAILMDCKMPGMDGLECTKVIRAMETGSDRRIPIIAFTSGEEENKLEQHCMAAGMDAFLLKSCSPDQIFETLQRLVYRNT